MMKASQKVGAETPISESSRATWSIQLSRRTAASTPSGTPTTTASTKATVESSIVAGAYCAMSASTGRCARDRDAEVAVHELGEEDPVLLPERQIEAPFGAIGGDQRLVGRLQVAELGEDRVGRHQARDDEDDEGGEHDHHDHAQHPRHEVAQQAAKAPAARVKGVRTPQEAGLILAISTCQPAAVSSKSSIELRVAIR